MTATAEKVMGTAIGVHQYGCESVDCLRLVVAVDKDIAWPFLSARTNVVIDCYRRQIYRGIISARTLRIQQQQLAATTSPSLSLSAFSALTMSITHITSLSQLDGILGKSKDKLSVSIVVRYL